ncbi:DUF58 domain-containing protein [Roseospirillum parvum]|uniref:DUF58 domain-containing protein n=1 Tax=Roseospirillum parvum TaxID=83401 RepID=A0A1G7ZRF9_9PROT|nr:DUF58 domain-containing protein [Roseospirillum parvum]SDH11268.1 Protein of unknown function DUF58 [Roseospirillum parvum]
MSRPAAEIPGAEALAAGLPPLLAAAERLAAGLQTPLDSGAHGRRRAGPGEAFWQYRPHQPGDPAPGIDWRRSARGDDLLVRQREWLSARRVLLWAAGGPGMAHASARSLPTKHGRASLLLLALAVLLVRGGERVGGLGAGAPPPGGRPALAPLAGHLATASGDLPAAPGPGGAALLLAGDFLGDLDPLARLARASRGPVHLLQVLDPAEVDLPWRGRVHFESPDGAASLEVPRVESVRADYRRRLAARQQALAGLVAGGGGRLVVHRTDRAPRPGLLALAAALAGEAAPGEARR